MKSRAKRQPVIEACVDSQMFGDGQHNLPSAPLKSLFLRQYTPAASSSLFQYPSKIAPPYSIEILGPTQISKDLEAQGRKAYSGLVSQSLGGSKKTDAKRGRKPGATKKTASKTTVVAKVNVQGIKANSEFVKLHGSADEAIVSIRSFQKLSALFQ
jgi:hypothetical protein